jgi:hypothetical protein
MTEYVLNVPEDMRAIHTLAIDAKVFLFLCVLAFILQCPSGLASVLGLSDFLLNRTVHINKQNYVLLLYETTSAFQLCLLYIRYRRVSAARCLSMPARNVHQYARDVLMLRKEKYQQSSRYKYSSLT